MEKLIKKITSPGMLRGAPFYRRYLEPREARYDDAFPIRSKNVARALLQAGIEQLYSHQSEALLHFNRGENPLVVTPTASGKSLIYQTAVLDALTQIPETRVLLLFPLKALEQDQAQRLTELLHLAGLSDRCRVAILDGDTPRAEREKLRSHPPHLLLTNPDMLHYGILAYHRGWSEFFRNLSIIVLDELHIYRGVFGSHVLQVIKRLSRICRFYNARPRWIAGSATIGNPLELARDLTGEEFALVERNGAPASGRHFLLLNPVESSYTLASRLLPEIMKMGFKTIAFTKSRRATELLHRWILDAHPELEQQLSSYRAGFLPEERRDIERRLLEDRLSGVISTSALELGMDVGGIDVCLLLGYPGTIAAMMQRAGRAGRRERESLVILITGEDALDQYYARHPDELFLRPSEAAVVDAANADIIRSHLVCAAAEIPLADKERYLDAENRAHLKPLAAERKLISGVGAQRWFPGIPNPHRLVNIRSIGSSYSIHDRETGRQIGDIGAGRLWTECHPQAIYLHRARQYWIESLDDAARVVYVRQVDLDYYTMALGEKDTEILARRREIPLVFRNSATDSSGKVCEGELKVTERVTGYQKRRLHSGELISTHELEGPPQILITRGFWIEFDAELEKVMEAERLHYMGGLHAAEHALISMFPLEVMCDRGDIGGISFQHHPQVESAAIFIYDAYPGGLGITRRAFERLPSLVGRTLALVRECPCEDGCPSCVHSPRCGAGNRPLDKVAAVCILSRLLSALEKDTSVSEQSSGVDKQGKPERIEPPTPPLLERTLPPQLQGKKVIAFDLETQRGPGEVGGWGNAHLMGLSVAVTQNLGDGRFAVYREEEVEKLLDELFSADLVVGFNCRRFDYAVLSGYSGGDFQKIPTFDILEELHKCKRIRCSLDALAYWNLGQGKLGSGEDALRFYRDGQWEQLEAYCRRDVEITGDLFYLIANKGTLQVFSGNHPVSVELSAPSSHLDHPEDKSHPQ
jgi:DEAD/DEAH box helicase domain-containing protein